MSSKKRRPRLRVLFSRDGNPLRRGVDRVEAAALIVLAAAFLVATPLLTLLAVRLVGAAGSAERHAEQRWRQVPAVLEQSAAVGSAGLNGDWEMSFVTAHWIAPDGASRTGLVAVQLNALAGQHVPIWVTRSGQQTHQPLSSSNLSQRAALTAVGVPVGIAVLVTLAATAVHAVANRRRLAGWARAWEATGPSWTSLR